MTTKRIGIAGVGMMGLGIATNLQRKGFPIALLEHPGNQDTGPLVASGAIACPDGISLARECGIIILCVTGSPEVEDVLTRRNGILAGLVAGTMIIDCSTAVPSSTLEMASLVREKGGRFMDAAMTRTPREAMEGRLNLLVGSSVEDLREMQPVLEAFSETIVHAGGVSAGHTLKLLHNFVSLGSIALIAEAAGAAARAGIDGRLFVDVLANGGGGGAALERMRPFLSEGDTGALKFTIANAHKDIGYYCAMSGDLGAERHVAEGVFAALNEALGGGHGQAFVPELARILANKEIIGP